jgi:long-chain acyl-CoA synthetase
LKTNQLQHPGIHFPVTLPGNESFFYVTNLQFCRKLRIVEPTRLFDIPTYQLERYPKKVALAVREGKRWTTFSSSELVQHVNSVSCTMSGLGLQRGERVAILARGGSPWWNFIDLGCQQVGLVVVPMHASSTTDEMLYILVETEARCCFVENDVLYEKLKSVRQRLPALQFVFSIEKGFGVDSLAEVLEAHCQQHLEAVREVAKTISTTDLATIIYTSGTTGEPKGVMLSHANILSNIKVTLALVPVNFEKTFYSFLPLSHVFERMVTYTAMTAGASVYYARHLDDLLTDLREIRPHILTCVPNLLDKMYNQFVAGIPRHNILMRKLLLSALRLGKKFGARMRKAPNLWLRLLISDLLVYRHWRGVFGGRLEGIIVGAAAMQQDVARLLAAAGIRVREGYGLTETSPVVSFNRFEPGGARLGTVGIPIPGTEVRIASPDGQGNGEILVRGPGVMMGYFRKPEETAAVIDAEGWFHTGDVGLFVEKKFLKITGRKKEIFKTGDGKYVAPQHVEAVLKSCPYISDGIVIGFNHPFVTALIVPDFALLRQWCEEHNVHWTAPQFMVINPKVEQLFQHQISELNQKLATHERIQSYHLLFEPWSVEHGQLSTTWKPRRHLIEKMYSDEIAKMYLAGAQAPN